MRFKFTKLYKMGKNIFTQGINSTIKTVLVFIILMMSFTIANSQIIKDKPPFVLTLDQLKSWTSTGPTADTINISNVPVATRFTQTETQLDTALTNDMEIMLVPDGMSLIANYIGEQTQFNLYNFTHWSYVDKLVWFGGPVLIPSAPWVDAAHKNGVKVYGTVFFGASSTISSFLEKDINDKFISGQKLKDIASYYNFDGWFFNMETTTTSTNGQLIQDFLVELTSILPEGQEVIWYDAMLPNGVVSYQNELNVHNSPMLQDGTTRVSDNMFTNFWWSGSTNPNGSKSTAQSLGRSEFEVYTAVDIWPGRNQGPFETSGNTWMEDLHSAENEPITSFGVFVPNALFQNSAYSNFHAVDNETERARFYTAEQHFFGGLDQNPGETDVTGYKGIGNWVPATSTITSLPFETNFNTGHGRIFATDGVHDVRDWHDMAKQDILPTWQFAIQGNSNLSASFDFTKSYNGGTSIFIEGDIENSDTTKLKLYKTKLDVGTDTKIDITYSLGSIGDTHMDVILVFSDDPNTFITGSIGSSTSSSWNVKTIDLSAFDGRELALIGFQFSSTTTINNYKMNIGRLKIFNGTAGENNAPIANFEADATSIKTGQTVNFSSASATGATSFSWSFPGGTPDTSTDENPVITYSTAGIFNVELAVTNTNGSDTETKTSYIDVDDQPLAAFTTSATSLTTGDIVNFTNTSVNATSYSWSFPGGTPISSTDENPTITYDSAGLFEVQLTAINSNGTDTLTKSKHIGVIDNTDIDHTDPPGTGTVTSRTSFNTNHVGAKAFDNLATAGPGGSGEFTTWTKFVTAFEPAPPSVSKPTWIQIKLPKARIVRTLVMVSANGAGRFPEDFALLGSNDGIDYDVLESWEDEPFIDLFAKKTLPFNNSTPYTYYKIEVYKNEADVTLTEILEIELRGPKSAPVVNTISSENNQIMVYPNPAKNNITLKGEFPNNTIVEIYSIFGKNVLTSQVNSPNITIPLQGISPGVYIMKLNDQHGFSAIKKIIIQ